MSILTKLGLKRKDELPGQFLICKRCGHKWRYTGESHWYASCPMCKTSVKIPS